MRTKNYFYYGLIVLLSLILFAQGETFAKVSGSFNDNSEAIPAGKKLGQRADAGTKVELTKGFRGNDDALPIGKKFDRVSLKDYSYKLITVDRVISDALPVSKDSKEISQRNFFKKVFEATRLADLWYCYIVPYLYGKDYIIVKQ